MLGNEVVVVLEDSEAVEPLVLGGVALGMVPAPGVEELGDVGRGGGRREGEEEEEKREEREMAAAIFVFHWAG